MAREISISFALTAALKGGFKAAFQGAAQSARNVSTAIREMEKTPLGSLGAAMSAQREKIKGLAGSLKEAREKLASLNAQAASGGTPMLARQIELADQRVRSLEGSLNRQLGAWRSTTVQAANVSGSVRRLSQDYEQLSQRMERARRVQSTMAANRAQADALRSQRSDLNSRLAGAAATAMTVATPVMLSIGFEDQMAKVGAVSKASKEDLAALTEQARQLGRDTSFSASQAAEGMQYLAMAGFKTNQVMAAMPGMLDLAAASGTDLGRTADIASNILSAFELKAGDMGHVGDVLVAAFTSSNTTLESLGETMKYVGPVAKDAGASIEDAVAMAGMLGNVGISGSQAGTASKSIFARLAAPPTEAAKALNALNIQTKDAQGNLRAVPDILEEITLKTASMGTADRTDVFSKVFGLEPMAGASALAKQAAQTVDENGKQIVDSMGRPTTALLKFADDLKHASDKVDGFNGVSQRTAAQMNATTGGALRRLRSAWEDTGISVGNLFLPAIQMAADGLSTIGNVISGAVQRFPNLSRGIGLVVGGVMALSVAGVALGLVMNLVKTSINGWRGALLRLSASQITTTATTGAASASAGVFGVASRLAGAGARVFAGGLRSILIASGVGALLVGLGFAINLLIDNWDSVVAAMSAAWGWVTDTWGRLGVFFSELGKNLMGIFPGVWEGICGFATSAWNRVAGVWNGITGFFSGLWNGIASAASSAWNAIVNLASSPVQTMKAIWQGIFGFYSTLWGSVFNIAKTVWQGIFSFITSPVRAVMNAWQSVSGFFSGLWQSIAGGASGMASTWAGIRGFFGSVLAGITGIFSSFWNGVTSLAASAFSGVAAVWNGIGAFFSAIGQTVISVFGWARDSVIGVWQGIGGFFSGVWSGIASGAIGLWQNVTGFASWAFDGVAAVWSGAVAWFDAIANNISGAFVWARDSVVMVWQGVADGVSGVWQNIVDMAAWAFEGVAGIWNGVVEFFSGIVDSIFGVFSGLFSWLQEKFAWVFSAIDSIGSVIGSITGAVKGAWNKAFGDDSKKSAAPNAENAKNNPVSKSTGPAAKAPVAQSAPQAQTKAATPNANKAANNSSAKPKYQPVSAKDYHAAFDEKKGKGTSKSGAGGGSKKGSGAGTSPKGASGGRGSASGSGPVTIVSVAGDNSQTQTVFIPASQRGHNAAGNAARSSASNAASIAANPRGEVRMPAVKTASAASDVARALPQAPALVGKRTASQKEKAAPASINIDLQQNFDLIAQDATAVRKVMETLKPDFERLVRKALEKMQSDRRRTAYAQ